jgi:hypothetical protein
VFLAKASIFNSPQVTAVRNAISTVVAGSTNVFNGADTDTIGAGGRYDGTHFNATGLASAASLWTTAIQANLPV